MIEVDLIKAAPWRRLSRPAAAGLFSMAAHVALLGWFAANASTPAFTPAREPLRAMQVRWAEPVPATTLAALALGPALAAAPAPGTAAAAAASVRPEAAIAAAAPIPASKPTSPQALAANTPPGVASGTVETAEPARAGQSFDVPPIPRDGWSIDVAGLASLPPGGPPTVAMIEVAVDPGGAILDWQLLRTNVDRTRMLALLNGIEHTAMLPATLGGSPVGARFNVEFSFAD